MKKHLFFVILQCFVFVNALAQPNIRLNAPISVSTSSIIPINSCITVSTNVKNLSTSSGTFDFECDLTTSSGTFITVIQKQCSISIAGSGTTALTFSTSNKLPYSPGSYKINIIVAYHSCLGCGTGASCITPITSGGYTIPLPVTISSATCTGYCMDNTGVSITASGGNFYDDGGASNDYGNSENYIKTFSPSTSTDKVRVTFSSFALENGFDSLYIYDGPNTSSTLVGAYTGSSVSSPITAFNSGGQLTFKFKSDGSNPCSAATSGWQATICASPGIPSSLTATALSSNSIQLSWPSVSGATSYNVYYSSSSCLGDLTVRASPTTSPFTVTGLSPSTTYYFNVRAVNSCGMSFYCACANATTSSSCTPPSAVSASVTGSAPYCDTARIVATGGTGGTIYFQGTTSNDTSISTPSASQRITSSGTYYFRSRASAGCWSTQGSVTVTINPLPTFGAPTVTNASCGSCTDGAISVSASGGTPSYLYSKNGGGAYQASNTFSSLAVGSYSICVKDAIGCQSATSSVSVPGAAPSIVINSYTRVDPRQRAYDSYTVSVKATTNDASSWKIVAYDPSGYNSDQTSSVAASGNTLTYVFTFNNPTSAVQYKVVSNTGASANFTSSYSTTIIDRKWDNNNVFYYSSNSDNNELKLPLKYTPGINSCLVSFSSPVSGSATFLTGSNHYLAPRSGGYTFGSSGTDGYLHIDTSNSNIKQLCPGVFNYEIDYYSGAVHVATETGQFDLTKIGNYGGYHRANDTVIVLIGGNRNTTENDIQSLTGTDPTKDFSVAQNFNYLNATYNTWYIGQSNTNYIKNNAYDIGVGLDSIITILSRNGISTPHLVLFAHSYGGVQVRAMLGGMGRKLDGTSNIPFSTFGLGSLIKTVIFLGSPHQGISYDPSDIIDGNAHAEMHINPNNHFLDSLNIVNGYSGDPIPNGIDFLNITGDDPLLNGDKSVFNIYNDYLLQTSDGVVPVWSSQNPTLKNSIHFFSPDQLFVLANSARTISNPFALHTILHRSIVLSGTNDVCDARFTNLDRIFQFIRHGHGSVGTCHSYPYITTQLQIYGSTLPGASVFFKQSTDTTYISLGRTDENSILNTHILSNSTIGDTIIIIAAGYDRLVIGIDSSNIGGHKTTVSMLKSLITTNKIQYPSLHLINETPITTNNAVRIKVSAKNATNYKINRTYDQDTDFITLSLTDSAFTAHLLPGINHIVVRYIGAANEDTLATSIYYLPDTLAAMYFYKIGIISDSSNLGALAYANNQFIKTIANIHDTILVPNGENSIKFCKLGYVDTAVIVDSACNLNVSLRLIPISYSSPTDSNIINFIANGTTQYWKTITVRDTSRLNIISLKQYDDAIAGMGLQPQSRKYELTHLNTAISNITFSPVIDQINSLNAASMYLMEIIGDTVYRKRHFDTLAIGASLDAAHQKINVNPVTFDSGRATQVSYAIMQKQPPVVINSDTIRVNENDSINISLTSRFADPDSVRNDITYTLIDSLPPGLRVSIQGGYVIIHTNRSYSGNTSFRINVTHDWLTITDTVNVQVIPNIVINRVAPATLCPGVLTTFSATIHAVTSPIYQWQKNGANVGGDSAGYSTATLHTGDIIKCKLLNRSDSSVISTSNQVTVTVNPSPIAGIITGSTTVCPATTTTLTYSVSGGVWSTNSPTIVTVDSAGVVTGIMAGTDTIKYAVTNVCGTATVIKRITVNPILVADTITGASAVCVGASTILTNTVHGGAWSSSDVSIATINGGGGVRGIATGSAVITYIVSNICGADTAYKPIAVITLPATLASITGTTTLPAIGSTTVLYNSTTGGTWSSSNTSILIVNSAGVVTSTGVGTATITYTVANSCGSVYSTINVSCVSSNHLPSFVYTTYPSNITNLCQDFIAYPLTEVLQVRDLDTGQTLTWSLAVAPLHGTASVAYSHASTGSIVRPAGVSYTPAVGYVGMDSMMVTVSDGIISSTSLFKLKVNPKPAASVISGASYICAGGTTALSASPSGGFWGSMDGNTTTNATTGVVRAVRGSGTSTIYYNGPYNSFGCRTQSRTTLTLLDIPSAGFISGVSGLCPGASATFSASVPGGAWASRNTSIASISAGGVVMGVSSGASMISYTVNNGCFSRTATWALNVYGPTSLPPINASPYLRVGGTLTLTNATAGGAWSSSNTSIATVSGTGLAGGVAAGVDTIYYSYTNGCGITSSVLKQITVLSHRDENEGKSGAMVSVYLKVYPNPTLGSATLELIGATGVTTVKVCDLAGKVITTGAADDAKVMVDFSLLAAGTYVVKVTNSGQVYTERVIVQ